jgi:hypothetical protein
MENINPVELEPGEKRRFWQEQIERQLQSKLTQAQYCDQNGLKLSQFIHWKYKSPKKTSAGVTFVSVPLPKINGKPAAPAALNLITTAGYRIEVHPGFDPVTLRQLIATLERP